MDRFLAHPIPLFSQRVVSLGPDALSAVHGHALAERWRERAFLSLCDFEVGVRFETAFASEGRTYPHAYASMLERGLSALYPELDPPVRTRIDLPGPRGEPAVRYLVSRWRCLEEPVAEGIDVNAKRADGSGSEWLFSLEIGRGLVRRFGSGAQRRADRMRRFFGREGVDVLFHSTYRSTGRMRASEFLSQAYRKEPSRKERIGYAIEHLPAALIAAHAYNEHP